MQLTVTGSGGTKLGVFVVQSAEVMRRELTARHEASVRGLLTVLNAKAAAVQQQVAAQTVLASLPLASVSHQHVLCIAIFPHELLNHAPLGCQTSAVQGQPSMWSNQGGVRTQCWRLPCCTYILAPK